MTRGERGLVERARAGDRAAFAALYQRHVGWVGARVARLLGPGPDVDDVVQEVFVQMHRSLVRFRPGEPLEPWLARIARNVTIDWLRRRARPLDLSALRRLSAPVDEWARQTAREKARILYAALGEVSAEAREAFCLHTFERLTLAEIAALTETSPNTVAARVRRTRERLLEVVESAERAEPVRRAEQK